MKGEVSAISQHGDACTFTDTCQGGECTGHACDGPTQACCPQNGGCVDTATDNANSGACGHACQNSVCFHGACYDGCVIGGTSVANGTRNPANDSMRGSQIWRRPEPGLLP
jgi:hypothetical protein